MSGWMEMLASLQLPQHLPQNPQPPIEAIVPTIVLPFALLGAIISSLVTAIAAWFGVTLKATGPKRLLEFLLKPKVLMSAIVLNVALLGGYKGYHWVAESARPLWWIQFRNAPLVESSTRDYADNWLEIDQPKEQLENLRSLREPGPISEVRNQGSVPMNLAWQTKLTGASFRGFSLSGGSAFAGTLDGFIFEIDQASGKILRRFYVGQPVVPKPVVFNQKLFVGEGEHLTHHARIYAFDLKSGRLAGVVETKGHTEGDLVIVDTTRGPTLFVPAGADGLYAIDPQTLKTLWHAPYPHFDSGVAVEGDQVFFATGIEKGSQEVTPRLYALDLVSGKLKWQTDLAASGWSRPVIFGGRVCVGLGEIYSARRYGQIACYDSNSGQSVSAMNFEAPVFNTPLVIENDILVSMMDGTLCRVNPISQTKTWCRQAPIAGKSYAWPALDHEGRIALPAKQGLVLLNSKTGESLGDWKPEGAENAWTQPYSGVTALEDGWLSVDGKGTVLKIVTSGGEAKRH